MTTRTELEIQAGLTTLLNRRTCTQVSLGGDDALILDFDELQPNLEGQLAGAIVLVIECPWRIDTPDLPAVGWEDDEEDVAQLSTALIGGAVEETDVRRPGFDLTLNFSNEYRLRIFPDCRAYYSDEMAGGALPWQIVGRDVPEGSHVLELPLG